MKVSSQTITQNIRGKITDKESSFNLTGASVRLYNDTILIDQSLSDTLGNFRIMKVPIGKYNVKCRSIGYKEVILSNITVSAGKELILNIELEEGTVNLKAITIADNEEYVNKSGSIRTFSVEETNRYAGSRSDPARMASNFAGVQGSDDSRNDLVIRGNSPLGVLWRYEGVDIPNPNHFAIVGTTGGPINIINNKVLANSYFMSGAFGAEYGNSTAGVFDMRMRIGNNEKHEFTGQFGFLGTEIAAEGPLSSKNGSSYLFAYRYSTLKLFESLKIPIGTNAIPNYQDLSLKINFPIKNKDNISLFSLGGISRIKTLVSTYKNPEDELYAQKDRNSYFGTAMNVSGLSYTKFLNPSAYLKITLAGTFSESDNLDSLVFRNRSFKIDSLIPKLGYRYAENKLFVNLLINKKLNRNISLQTGVVANEYMANMIDSNYNQVTYKFENRLHYKGNTYLIQPYATFKIKINEFFNVNGGIHSQYLTLNTSTSIEPRIMLQYKPTQKQSIGFSYGMHSQMQPLYIYFYQIRSTGGNYEMHNKNLGFSRSNHFVLTYDYFFGRSTRFKAEAYFQSLYNVPINTYSSSFSMLNQGMKRFYPDSLKNEGTGKNLGLELTLEKFFDKAYFFLLTVSLYDSKYKGSDGIERATDFNGNYILNLLAGKDFKINDRKTFGVGTKITYSGGKRYTPIDVGVSQLTKEDVFIDSQKNTLRFKPYFRADIKINYRVNSKKLTHELGLDLINVFGIKNILSITYSTSVPGKILETYQLGFLPLFYYKLDF